MRETKYICDDCNKIISDKEVKVIGSRDYCGKCLSDRVKHSFMTYPKKNCPKCSGKGTTTWWDYGEPRSEECTRCKGCGYKVGV